MNKESEKLKQIEENVDCLNLKNLTADSPVSHSSYQMEKPSSRISEMLFGVHSDQNEQKKKDSCTVQGINNEQKSDFSSDLNEKYQLIALNTSDLIAFTTFDLNPTFTFVSPSHKKILGYSEEDMLGKSGLDFIHEDDIEQLLELLIQYIDAKKINASATKPLNTTQNIDFRFRDKSGQWHVLRSTVDIVKNELLFVSKDITDYKKSQEALIESEKKYRNLYDNLRDGFAAVDLTGKITECNTAFANMLGYSMIELRNFTYNDITPVKWHEFESRILNGQVKIRGYSDLYEKEYIHKNGTIFPIEIQTYALNDDRNGLCGFWAFVRDSSIRKKMDFEQKKNQEQIKAIVMNAPIGIATCGTNKYFINANDAFCKILGYTESELQKMTFEDITHVDDLKESNQSIKDLYDGKISYFSLEKRYIKKDKSEIFGKVIVSTIRDQQGVPSIFIAELEDITNRKRMDQALKKSEEKFMKAFKSSPVAIALTRMSDGRFLEVNKSVEKLIGYTRDELLSGTTVGLNIWVDSNDRKFIFDELKRVGSVFDHEFRFRAKNGSIIVTRYSAEVINFGDEQAILSVCIDITDYKKSNELLRESEEKYRSIVENTRDVIMLTNPMGRVDYISPACLDVLGTPPHDVVGKIPEIFHHDDVEKVHSALAKALEGVPGANFEYRVLTKNGSVRWVSHSWAPVSDQDKKLKYIVSVVRNITDTKVIEQDLKIKIEELERYKNITVNREMKMIQLKKENQMLKERLMELEENKKNGWK